MPLSGRTYTNYKDNRPKPRFPSVASESQSPMKWGDVTGPGVPGTVGSDEATRLGNSGVSDVERGYIPSHVLQNPLLGTRVYAPKGSAGNVSFGFRSGPTGTSTQEAPGTGVYQAASGEVNVATGGALRVTVDSTKLLAEQDIHWKSGTSFLGKQEHANSADRTYTFPDKSITVAGLDDIGGGGWTTVPKKSNETKNTDNTLAADTELFFDLLADRYYEFVVDVWFDTSSTAGFDWRHVGTAAATTVYISRYTQGCGNTTHANIATDTAYSAADISVPGTGSTGGHVHMEGFILNGKSASTFEFHWAQGVSEKSNTVVRAGSRILYFLQPT